MSIRPALTVAALLVAVIAPAPPAAASGPQPRFQLPFPCGQVWHGNSGNSSAHAGGEEIDFNRGNSAEADRGDTVVAAAAGRVVTSAHQGSANGYGNLVKIDHGEGWYTYYAHLDSRAVRAGATVEQGQAIGTVGDTTKPSRDVSPHLHFEVRNDASYPASVRPAVFDGVPFDYPDDSVTSDNCGGGSTPAADPVALCGSGHEVIDRAHLDSGGTRHGTVYLLYNASNAHNCVVTVKTRSVGTPVETAAYLEPEGRARATDSGSFLYYAGPVDRPAPGCIRWGGAISGVGYDSPSEHCGS